LVCQGRQQGTARLSSPLFFWDCDDSIHLELHH
jgi:hypothetical protein